MRTVFTSESVTEGHPDKICDQISDAVLDAILAKDPMARVACETCATIGLVQVMGEITTSTYVAIDEIARQVIRDIGYTSSDLCFDGNSCAVLTAVHALRGSGQAQQHLGLEGFQRFRIRIRCSVVGFVDNDIIIIIRR